MELDKEDKFWLWIGALIVAVIIGVFLLKSREMESVPADAYAETKARVEKHMQKTK